MKVVSMEMGPELLTGIDEIDGQHQSLFDCVTRLEKAISSREKWNAVHFALTQLADFVRVHFAVEEALMRIHAYPDRDVHIAAHRGFSKRLDEFREASIRVDVAEDMTHYLRRWLVEHIGKTDQAYLPHLRTQAVVDLS